MRALRVHDLGDPTDVMSLDDVAPPIAGAGQLLVRVRAAGLNFPDVLMAQGRYQERRSLPYIPGIELCGEVVGTGQRVLGQPAQGSGAFAEYAVMDTDRAWPVPDSLSDEKAAALFVTYQTGYGGLHQRAGISAGDWLLVHAGAGGVGSAAIQLGKAAGARVIATAGGARKVEVCRTLGADHVVDYTREDFAPVVDAVTDGHGADVVYDPVGGNVFAGSVRCIAFEGRLVVVGFTSGSIPAVDVGRIRDGNYSVIGLRWGLYREKDPARMGVVHAELTKLVESGSIDPLVSGALPLEQAPKAFRALADRRTVGKLVLVP